MEQVRDICNPGNRRSLDREDFVSNVSKSCEAITSEMFALSRDPCNQCSDDKHIASSVVKEWLKSTSQVTTCLFSIQKWTLTDKECLKRTLTFMYLIMEKIRLEIYIHISVLKNENSIYEEMKCRLKAGNSCYYSVQTLFSSRLPSENLKI